MKQRRDLIGRYWLNKVSPLEEFSLSGDQLRFSDLAVDRGYVEADGRKYECWIDGAAPQACSGNACAVVPPSGNGDSPPDRYGRTPSTRVMIRASRREGGWAAPVEVILGHAGSGSRVDVLGWRHAPR